MTNAHRKRIESGLLIFAAWTAAAPVYATHLYLFHTLRNQPTTFLFQLAEACAHFWVWAALTPLVLRTARRIAPARMPWPRIVVLQIAAAIGVAALQLTLHVFVDQTFIHRDLDLAILPERFMRTFTRTFYANLLIYALLVIGSWILQAKTEREVRAAHMEAQLTHAQMDALRSRLQPHFLFNALNSIATLIRHDPGAAEMMVTRLGDLLRNALSSDGRQLVPLADELALVERYLDVERVRFEERLGVDIRVSAGLETALVPPFLLQPLVENAIRHGIGERRGPLRIEIEASQIDGTLRLRVSDDGRGLEAARKEGLGLSATRNRLRQLYGDACRFDLRDRSPHGVDATIEIPLREGVEPEVSG
ncbi:MAG TPA: histidine kinase [Thermoanaerobaculia bacterium]|nr:histidine kinase [Thermoanaerobaculia bacterium]